MSPLVQFALAGLGTYLIRASAILVMGRVRVSDGQRSVLRLIAPAVLAAIVADRLFVSDGDVVLRGTWLIAGGVAGLVATRGRSAIFTILAGMATVWLFGALT